MEVGLTASHGVPRLESLKYDMDAYMATLFGGEVWDVCCKSGQAKQRDSTLDTSPASMFALSN